MTGAGKGEVQMQMQIDTEGWVLGLQVWVWGVVRVVR